MRCPPRAARGAASSRHCGMQWRWRQRGPAAWRATMACGWRWDTGRVGCLVCECRLPAGMQRTEQVDGRACGQSSCTAPHHSPVRLAPAPTCNIPRLAARRCAVRARMRGCARPLPTCQSWMGLKRRTATEWSPPCRPCRTGRAQALLLAAVLAAVAAQRWPIQERWSPGQQAMQRRQLWTRWWLGTIARWRRRRRRHGAAPPSAA